MSRHSLNLPTSFFHRFSTDVAQFANLHSRSNVVAVLEGGYSDRALASGSLALMIGLAEASRTETGSRTVVEGRERWSEARLMKMESDCAAGGKVGKRATKLIIPPVFPPPLLSTLSTAPSTIDRTGEIYRLLHPTAETQIPEPKPKPLDIRKMQLRGRRVNAFVDTTEEEITPRASPAKGKAKIAAVRLTKSVISTPVAAKLDPVDVPELPASAPRAFKFTWKEGGVL